MATIQQTDGQKRVLRLVRSWCERRSHVFEALGMPQLAGMAWMFASGGPRKGKTEMKKNLLIVFFALLLTPLYTHAQGLGSIVGSITDPAGAGIAGAQVTATQVGTGYSRSAITDAEGLYVLPSLRPAVYNLAVEAKGFSTLKQSGITLLADQTLTLNMGMKLGTVAEVVTVEGSALQVDTATSTLR